ncbi:MAG: TetR/AcrR family transcriptional regulator [Myxococcota bacterium]
MCHAPRVSEPAKKQQQSTDGRVVRARARRRQRREQILEACREVFAERGYHGSSVQDILDAAGIARGTFYAHFDSKRAAFAELMDDFAGRLAGAIERVDVEGKVPIQRQLEANVERVLTLVEENRDLADLLLHQSSGVDTVFDDTVRDFYGRVMGLILRSLRTGEALGILRPGDLDLRARLVFGAAREAILRLVDEPIETRPEHHHVVHELLDLVLHGLLR